MLVEIKILECHYMLRRIMQGIKKSENSRKYVILTGPIAVKNRERNYRIAIPVYLHLQQNDHEK